MPAHRNPKMEAFANNLARGMKQGIAYEKAGYARNAGAASRQSKDPAIVDRVAEIKGELDQKVHKMMTLPTDLEVLESLAEMGITLSWCAVQYQLIYEHAIRLGSLPAANTAIQNIQKLVEMEGGGKKIDEEHVEGRLNVSEVLQLLDKMGDIAHGGGRIVNPDDDSGIPMLPDLESFEVIDLIDVSDLIFNDPERSK